MKTLMTFKISDEMWTDIKIIKQVGGKVFLVVGEKMAQGCMNCNGNGYLHLQTVVGGPFDYVPMSICNDKNHVVPTVVDEKWCQVKIKGYACPVCGGEQIVSQLHENINNAQLEAAAGNMRVKHSYREGQRQLEQKAAKIDTSKRI